MEKMTKGQKIIIMLVIIIPLAFLVLYLTFRSRVVTKETHDKSKLPQINISGSDTKEINKILSDLYKEYIKDDKSTFNYTYSEYENILSMLITIEDYIEDSDEYIIKYLGYNIDKKTKRNIANDELIEKLNYDFDSVVEQVNNKFKEYYSDIKDQGYIENSCDYNCFLAKHNINYLLEKVAFVIENNELVAYINLGINSNLEDSEYFRKLKNPYRLVIRR